jgi:thiamine pyrophosphokinase
MQENIPLEEIVKKGCEQVIVIVAGGPQGALPAFKDFNSNTRWIGVDRGLYTLIKSNITPEEAFGDFDSITEAERKEVDNSGCKLHTYSAEKDETDLELAINWALQQEDEQIVLLGCTGGRLDHELINIQMLNKGLETKKEIIICDKQNKIIIREPGTYSLEKEELFQYVSFIPQTKEVKGLSLEGFKYPLHKKTINWGETLCISNELLEKKGTYSFDSGILMVVKSRDA